MRARAAARAAGIRVQEVLPGRFMRYDGTDGNYSKHAWDPLTDDGDALRLAVRLHVDVSFEEPLRVRALGHGGSAEETYPIYPSVATRRAITRAAAMMAPASSEELSAVRAPSFPSAHAQAVRSTRP